MTAMAPVEVYGLKVPAGSVAVEADGGVQYPATFRITMAAIDPTAEVDPEHPRVATLKLIKIPSPDFDDEDEEDYDESDEDDDDVAAIEKRLGLTLGDDEDDEDSEDGAGPSDLGKGAKARAAAALAAALEADDDEGMADAPTNGVNGAKKNKGKGKVLDALAALQEEDDDLDDEDLDDLEADEDRIQEYVICTLDPTKNCQQPLDITLNNENELCYFQVSGGYDIHLTGNFVIPPLPTDDEDDEDEDDYDDEDMMLGDGLDEDLSDMEADSEEDELDDIDDPRIMEVDSEEEVPALVKASLKGKNKRAAEDASLDAIDVLDKIVANEAGADAKLSKKDMKKLKNNAGEAVPAAAAKKDEAKAKATPPKDAVALAKDAAKDTPTSNGKKVQFAKNLEQGPTPSKTDAKGPALGAKVVDGVTLDDKKLGQGKAAKKGNKVELRYIGKLKDGKVFDSNKKGKPFSFNLGAGEVVKGMDIGILGMQVGGERRITIPSKLGYGSKAMGSDIPANSDLIFDIKLIAIK